MSIVIQDVIQALIKPVGHIEQSVDTLLYGDPQAQVTGIVTTFMPSQLVLEEAVALGANLIIAHEGPFYSHHNTMEKMIEDDPVYLKKKTFILNSGLAIFRLHDYVHRYQPDGIIEGLIHALAWESYVTEHRPVASLIEVPPMTVKEIAEYVKGKLGLSYVRVVGDMGAPCRRVGVLVGYRGGGQLAIPLFVEEKLDLIIYGEGPEWETPEYVRDATMQGSSKGLIVIGHAESEQSGMKLLAERVQQQFPDIPVRFVANEAVFRFV
jgi:putative NIF3 family GTP cyclohydrolase 1 type 2